MWWVGKRGTGSSRDSRDSRGLRGLRGGHEASRTAIAYASDGAVRLALGGVTQVASVVDGREAALAALAAGLRELPRGTRLRIAVGGAVCRPFLLPEIDGAAGDAEWPAIAAALVEDATGLPPGSPVWLDGGQTSPRLAVAIDAAWLRGIEALGGRALDSIKPWWALAIDASTPSPFSAGLHGLAVADSEMLVLLLADGERYRVAQTYPLEGEAPQAVLSRALVTHDWPDEAVRLIEFDAGALPGQPVSDPLPFSKAIPRASDRSSSKERAA